MKYKIQKFLFINHKSISSFVHLTSIMPGRREVKHSTKTASSDRKSEDFDDDPMYIVRTPNKIYNSFKERMKILLLYILFNIKRQGVVKLPEFSFK